VAGHPVAAFLAMVYVLSLAVALVPVLTRRDILLYDLALYDSLAPIFGVALPACLVMVAMHGKAGVRDLASRCLRWRVGVRWYLIALFSVPLAVVLCASAVFGLSLLDRWSLLFTQVLPQKALFAPVAALAFVGGLLGYRVRYPGTRRNLPRS